MWNAHLKKREKDSSKNAWLKKELHSSNCIFLFIVQEIYSVVVIVINFDCLNIILVVFYNL